LEKGRALLDAAGRGLALLLAEMDSLPLSTLVHQTQAGSGQQKP
jgi:hypothetical protein